MATVAPILPGTADTAVLRQAMAARWRALRAGEALLEAISAGDDTRVLELLPHADVHLAEALEEAANAGRVDMLRLLLDAGERGAVPERLRRITAHRLHSDRLFAYAATARVAAHSADAASLLERVAAVTLMRVQDALAANPGLREARNWLGHTLLHTAAATGNLRVLEAILDGTPQAGDEQGHTPLATLANRMQPSERGPRDDGCDVARALIAAGADVRARSGPERQTPLHMAARRGNVALAAVLLEHGAEIDAQTTLGETPLRRAVNLDHVPFAVFLVARGADPCLPDRKGVTPVQAARSASMRAALAQAPAPATTPPP